MLLFSGHRVDAPGRVPHRFASDSVAKAAAAIDATLEVLQAGPEDLALTQGSSGGDLLFAEACVRRSVPLRLMQPHPEPRFIEESVRGSSDGARWVDRYLAVRAAAQAPPLVLPFDAPGDAAAEVLGDGRGGASGEAAGATAGEASGDRPGDPPGDVPGDATTEAADDVAADAAGKVIGHAAADRYERCNRWLLETALAWGPERLRFICLWDGRASDGPGGTADLVAAVRRLGLPVIWLDARHL